MAAAQKPTFIDLTRSFLPCTPSQFPQSMHVADGAPENHVPVMAYYGKNFLPTSYGYKSFFGTNQDAGVDNIPYRVDYLFVMQDYRFHNWFIALTEGGVYLKDASSAGGWTEGVSYTPPTTASLKHYEWSYVLVQDELYCYLAGKPGYVVIRPFDDGLGLQVSGTVPNFLNMAGQLGIFRAGARLGFWDSEGSISWSSLDDYNDFTPSLTTLAGNEIFKDMKGRLIMMKQHAEGFLIYATKSIIYVAPDPTSTYQWLPRIVLSDIGIAFPRQVAVDMDDKRQFIWAANGLYKIEQGQADNLVPNVQDFIKQSNSPHYLSVLDGRFLCLESMDPGFESGQVQFSQVDVSPIEFVFPGSTYTLEDAVDDFISKGSKNFCELIKGYGKYANQTPTAVSGIPAPSDKKPNTYYQPVYACYISDSGVIDIENVTFDMVPCGTTNLNGDKNWPMTPHNAAGSVSKLSTDKTNKRRVLGSDMYVDGHWTIERFIQVQTAIWEAQNAALQAYIQLICSQAYYDYSPAADVATCIPSSGFNVCELGTYVMRYSDPEFGFSGCQFWLTRYALEGADITAQTNVGAMCVAHPELFNYDVGPLNYWGTTGSQVIQSSPTEVCNRYFPGGVTSDPPIRAVTARFPGTILPNNYAQGTCDVDPGNPGQPGGAVITISSLPIRTAGPRETIVAHTHDGRVDWAIQTPAGFYSSAYKSIDNICIPHALTPTPDTAFCVIAGWEYEKNDGSTGFINNPDEHCDMEPAMDHKLFSALGLNSNGTGPSTKDGNLCGHGFEPFTLPGEDDPHTYEWPTETLTIPGGQYRLQNGSDAPIYPTMYGALVYDMLLKKWGKMVQTYKILYSNMPLNAANNGMANNATFGITGGLVYPSGQIRVFDAMPVDSYIAYGKVGYYRLGMTRVEEVRVDFASPSTGILSVQGSLKGQQLSSGFLATQAFDNATSVRLTGGPSGRWHDIRIDGIFDISYIQYNGIIQGKR